MLISLKFVFFENLISLSDIMFIDVKLSEKKNEIIDDV